MTEKYTYEFACESRQNYFPNLEEEIQRTRKVDRVYMEVLYPTGNLKAEVSMIWYDLGKEVYPRLCIFSDAFVLFKDKIFVQLLKKLSEVTNKQMTSDEFSKMLIELGFKDKSDNPLKSSEGGTE